jgi:hypothetical protein
MLLEIDATGDEWTSFKQQSVQGTLRFGTTM